MSRVSTLAVLTTALTVGCDVVDPALPASALANGATSGTATESPPLGTGFGLKIEDGDIVLDASLLDDRYWNLGGNAPSRDDLFVLGTIDESPLELIVNDERVLRIEPAESERYGFAANTIGGFSGNIVAEGVVGATIAGGGAPNGMGQGPMPNLITDALCTVGGGAANQAGDGNDDLVDARYATVGGGSDNIAGRSSSTVGGGSGNLAEGTAATIGGGLQNVANGASSCIAGGRSNVAGEEAVVAGGASNSAEGRFSSIGGGGDNEATGKYATLGGGRFNEATGDNATVPGGLSNVAEGKHSFAAGLRAKALHDGSFVWHDGIPDSGLQSTAPNQFSVRANGGARFLKSISSPTFTSAGVQIETGSTIGEAAWMRTGSANNPFPVLKLVRQTGGNNHFAEGFSESPNGNSVAFWIDGQGTFYGGSDFAEALPVRGERDDYEPGDVVVLSVEQPGSVEKCGSASDARVAGVYSTRPAVLGAEKGGETRMDPEDVPVGITGIVPTKVSAENGPIQPGDLLCTSPTPGHAMKATAVSINGVDIYPTGTILGKAMGSLPTGTGNIKVLIMPQ